MVALPLAIGGCGGNAAPPAPPPIVLISIDTLRSDHLPAYGYRGVATPALDRLRRDSILFERAYSHVPLTLPSHVSILTGLLPPEHGVRDNSGYPFVAAAHPFLPALLHAAGYDTAAFVSCFVLHPSTGLAAGFDVYDAGYPGEEVRAELLERPGAETVDAAIRWLRQRGEAPFFLFVHLYEPHAAYRPPEPFASRYRDRLYDGEIATADAAVGALLAALRARGLYDRAAIVLLSDHGEGLGDHGENGHGIFLYREALQVPLLLKLPGGSRAGTAVATPAELVDVAPTLLHLAGRAVPAAMHGRSLVDLAAGDEAAPRQVYSETLYPRLHLGWSAIYSLVEGPLHYIHGPAPELFDLAADPAERRNVALDHRRALAAMREALVRGVRAAAAPAAVDAETARRLAALGYGGTPRATSGALPDPRTRRDALRDIERAQAASGAGRWQEAAGILETLTRREPDLLDGWMMLASCREHLDRPEETLAAYQRALELGRGAPQYAFYVARQLYAMGRFAAARHHAELMLAGDPGSRDADEMLAAIALHDGDPDAALDHVRRAGRASATLRRDLARALALRGRGADALAMLGPGTDSGPAALDLAQALSNDGRQVEASALLAPLVAADPTDARALELLGVVALREGRPLAARAQLERALAVDARRPAAWTSLGVALYQLGDPSAAMDAWRRALACDPGQSDALLDLGLVAAEAGRHAEAREALHRFVALPAGGRSAADLATARRALRELGG